MGPRSSGVSTYLETFILIAVALGGTGVVYSTLSAPISSAAGGPSLTVSNVVLRQGSSIVIEKLEVSDTGTTSFTWFTVTASIPSSPSFCVTLQNAATQGTLAFSSPPYPCSSGSTSTNPSSITVTPTNAIGPGQSVILAVFIYSSDEFSVGSGYAIYVVASGGALQTATAVVAPG